MLFYAWFHDIQARETVVWKKYWHHDVSNRHFENIYCFYNIKNHFLSSWLHIYCNMVGCVVFIAITTHSNKSKHFGMQLWSGACVHVNNRSRVDHCIAALGSNWWLTSIEEHQDCYLCTIVLYVVCCFFLLFMCKDRILFFLECDFWTG